MGACLAKIVSPVEKNYVLPQASLLATSSSDYKLPRVQCSGVTHVHARDTRGEINVIAPPACPALLKSLDPLPAVTIRG